ncbi:MAG: hypothetical protein WC953_10025 [Pseudomonas sp.]
MKDYPREPDERALTEAARRQLEEDNRENTENRPMGPTGNVPSREEAERLGAEGGLTEAAIPDSGPTADDAAPETLLPDDGARSAAEAGGDTTPADSDLNRVSPGRIGGGSGLDEAELGRVKPLDGQTWDGDPDTPLQPNTVAEHPLATPTENEPDQQ